MKIAFASCFDALKDTAQPVWAKVLPHRPEVLLLLGDSIYMDYFPHLGQSKQWTNQGFADEMYRRYAAQWAVASFRSLVESVESIGVTWDDHDFAWNGSCGAGVGKNGVPRDKRLISRALFLQFRDKLRTRPVTTAYPAQPVLPVLLQSEDKGTEEVFDRGRVRVLMLDGRTFREDPHEDLHTTLLGAGQKAWMLSEVKQWPGLCILCCGSTLAKSKESWDCFNDYEWLISQKLSNVIVLTGDIHENAFRVHQGDVELTEVVSSGAARPGLGGDQGNYGLLNVQPDDVEVLLFDKHGIMIQKTVHL